MTDYEIMPKQVFAIRFSNGDLRNYRIEVKKEDGYANWNMSKRHKFPSEWFGFRVEYFKDSIGDYLEAAQRLIKQTRKEQHSLPVRKDEHSLRVRKDEQKETS